MLLALSIVDFVIVERLDLEFFGGFTVLTGETGAGKSILIDALQTVLGERTQADAVRDGCERADIGAEFAAGPEALAWLAQAGFDAPAGAAEPVLVRRTLDRSGRSRGFINGSPATLGQLRALGEHLLDVHGQHEHQLLLRPAAQQQLLDAHGHLEERVRAVGTAYAAWRTAAGVAREAETVQAQRAAETGQLREQADELEALAPQAGEWERIEAEQRRLANAAALLDGTRWALDALDEGEDALQPRLVRLQSRLATLQGFDPQLAGILDALGNAQIHIGEAARALGHYLSGCDIDERRLGQIDERIGALHAASRKWRCPPADLAGLLDQARARLAQLDTQADPTALRAVEAQAAAHYDALAGALRAARQQAARAMGTAVTAAMQDLAMAGGRLEVALLPAEPGTTGIDKVEYLVSAHAAGTARPLAKVASGGELSRIGLAIAVVAAAANPVPTLIFDEVDAGIGGPVAATVGRRLRQLGAARQVFCVTHLPQVASCGDHHLSVRKSTRPGMGPISQTEVLSGDARVQEIARMLGGAQITTLTQKHAREMLAQP